MSYCDLCGENGHRESDHRRKVKVFRQTGRKFFIDSVLPAGEGIVLVVTNVTLKWSTRQRKA